MTIVDHSHVVSSFAAEDLILADKGFAVHALLPDGVNLNIPPFLRGKAQFTKEDGEMCRKIARARIYIERANERIKNCAILSHVRHNYVPFIDKIIHLCCALVNLQSPLLKEMNSK